MATEVIRHINPDATGAGDGTSEADAYTTPAAWETAEKTDLQTGDLIHRVRLSTGGSPIGPLVVSSGWNSGPANQVIVEAIGDYRAIPEPPGTGRAVVTNTDSSAVAVNEDYVILDGFYIKLIYGVSDTFEKAVAVSSLTDGANLFHMRNCYLICEPGATIKYMGMDSNVNANKLLIQNCIFQGFPRRGVQLLCAPGSKVQHCIVEGATAVDGYRDSSGAGNLTCENCVATNCLDDFDSVGSVVNCMSDDGDGTNPIAISGGDIANEYSDPANGEWYPKDTGNGYQAGATLGDGPATDMLGNAWNATPTVGAVEYAAAGWGGKIDGVTPTKINGIPIANIAAVDGASGVAALISQMGVYLTDDNGNPLVF
jgi:hypothetical protein